MKNIAIIPARSGSKGLKNKNILRLNGVPLMGYSIQAALQSKLMKRVIVSTDSEEYAEIAKSLGAEVPFLRSENNSSDDASSWDVVREVINFFQQNGEMFDNIVLLQPTSPLRTSKDIIAAYNMFIEKQADSVVSVSELEHSLKWCNTLPDDNCMQGFLRQNIIGQPRQKLERYYRLNGAIYILTNVEPYEKMLYNEKSYAYIMDRFHSIDIDNRFDFVCAEAIIKSQV